MRSVVLFGAGSALIVDVEETCRRLGIKVAAVVRNHGGPSQASDPSLVVTTDEMPDGLLRTPVTIPLFKPENREAALSEARKLGACAFEALIDPTAVLPSRITICEGAYVNAGCTLGAEARLGRFALVNRGAVIGHHAVLGDFSSIGPGVVMAGQVSVGKGAMIGAGAVLLPKVTIGPGATVAAGAIVDRDVPAKAVAASPRARIVSPGPGPVE